MISIEEHMTKENKEIDLFKTSYDLRKRSVLLKTLPRKHTFTPDSSKLQTYRETTYFDVSVEIIQPGKRPDIMELSCYNTLNDLKVMVQQDYNIPFENQIVRFKEKELFDSKTLTEYFVEFGDTLTVSVKPKVRRLGRPFDMMEIAVVNPVEIPGQRNYTIQEVFAPTPSPFLVLKRIRMAVKSIISIDQFQAATHLRNRVWGKAPHKAPLQKRIAVEQDKGVVLPPLSSLRVPGIARQTVHLKDIQNWLSNMNYFSDLGIPQRVMDDVAKNVEYHHYDAGDILFKEGDAGDWFYIVISGYVALTAYGTGLQAIMGPGDCFGEMCFLEVHSRRNSSAIMNYTCRTTDMALIHRTVYARCISSYKMANKSKISKLISATPSLQNLNPTIVTNINYISQRLIIEAKTALFKQDERVEYVYFLARGCVKITSVPQKKGFEIDSKIFVVDFMKAPKVFGQECLLDITQHAKISFSIQAINKCTLLRVPKVKAHFHLSQDKSNMEAIMREHINRLTNMEERLELRIEEYKKEKEEEEEKEKEKEIRQESRRKSSIFTVPIGGLESTRRRSSIVSVQTAIEATKKFSLAVKKKIPQPPKSESTFQKAKQKADRRHPVLSYPEARQLARYNTRSKEDMRKIHSVLLATFRDFPAVDVQILPTSGEETVTFLQDNEWKTWSTTLSEMQGN